jgi:hypothetical protein
VKLDDPPNGKDGNIIRSLSKEQTRLDNRIIQMDSKITIEYPEKEKELSDGKEINLQ